MMNDRKAEDPKPRRTGRLGETFESGLSASRLVVIFPVLLLLLSALGAFVYGADVFIQSAREIIDHPLPVGDHIGLFLLVVDLLLIGATMLIAAVGFYELFISPIGGEKSRMPSWLQMHDLNELKARVIAMIILVAAVRFAELIVDEVNTSREVLETGIGIAVVVVALTAFLRYGTPARSEADPTGRPQAPAASPAPETPAHFDQTSPPDGRHGPG